MGKPELKNLKGNSMVHGVNYTLSIWEQFNGVTPRMDRDGSDGPGKHLSAEQSGE